MSVLLAILWTVAIVFNLVGLLVVAVYVYALGANRDVTLTMRFGRHVRGRLTYERLTTPGSLTDG